MEIKYKYTKSESLSHDATTGRKSEISWKGKNFKKYFPYQLPFCKTRFGNELDFVKKNYRNFMTLT